MPVMHGMSQYEGLGERQQASNGNATILLSATLSQQQQRISWWRHFPGVRRSVRGAVAEP